MAKWGDATMRPHFPVVQYFVMCCHSPWFARRFSASLCRKLQTNPKIIKVLSVLMGVQVSMGDEEEEKKV